MKKLNDSLKDFNREKEGLKGKVKSVETKIIEFTEKNELEQKKVPCLIYYVLYDENGNKLEYNTYDINDGSLWQQQRFVYNDLGCKREWIYYKQDNSPGETHYYFYNSIGILTKSALYDSSFVYFYDAENRLTEYHCYENNVLDYKSIYEYNESEKSVIEVRSTNDGTSYINKIYNFDEKDNLIEILDKEFEETYVYAYDEKGQQIKFSSYKNNESFNFEKIYTLDNDGNALKEILFRLCQNEKTIEKKNYSYEFDIFGNWIKREYISLISSDKETYKCYGTEYRYITYY